MIIEGIFIVKIYVASNAAEKITHLRINRSEQKNVFLSLSILLSVFSVNANFRYLIFKRISFNALSKISLCESGGVNEVERVASC